MRPPTSSVLYHRIVAAIFRRKFSIGERAKLSWRATLDFKNGAIAFGRRATIHPGAIVDAQDGSIIMGDHVSINPYSVLYGSGGIRIGNCVRIATQVVIVSFEHNYHDPDVAISWQGISRKSVTIEDDVWLGAGAKVLAGAYISKGCVIAANAVVKGRTEPYGVYAGVPARKVASRLPK